MASARQTRDHGEIRRWVEDRGGIPTVVDGTGGLLRVDFVEGPKSGGRNPRLEEVGWDEWFRIFDDNDLVFLCQPQGDSKFFKLISSGTARASENGARRSSRRRSPARRQPKRATRSRRGATRKKTSGGQSRSRGGSGVRSSGRRGAASAKRGAARTAAKRGSASSRSRGRSNGSVTRRKVRKGGRTVTMECREV